MYHCALIRIHAYSRAFTGFMHKQRIRMAEDVRVIHAYVTDIINLQSQTSTTSDIIKPHFSKQALFKMPQSTSTAPQERAQPWKAMQEVQNLFKPEVPAAAETADKAEEEEPLKLNLLRAQFNSARSNIANVEEKH
ncbi:SUR7/PalI family protein [Aspergillus niger]|nr:hypothetical protein M747DRAFT_367551 [Aspergillus niger ATCC 13496]TPR08105.1 SUR7/PalI family protein [Aspergillus niger]